MTDDDLGERIRRARERKGWTQAQVAKEVQVSARTIGNWERGEAVPRNSRARLSDVLGLDVVPAGDTPGYVATGTGRAESRLTEDEVLALIRESRRLADELERRIQGGT